MSARHRLSRRQMRAGEEPDRKNGSPNKTESKGALSPRRARGAEQASIAHIILPFAAVETTGAQATGLESFFRSRTGTDRCARVSRSAPCRRGRCDRRGARAFRTDNPRLRLRVTSKARQVVEIIIALLHDTPPWLGMFGTRADMTARLGDVQTAAWVSRRST